MQLFDIAARDSSNGELKHFCQVCNYPADVDFNLRLHNQSEEHKVSSMHPCLLPCNNSLVSIQFFDPIWFVFKLAAKKAQEEDNCESRNRGPEWDPVGEIRSNLS